MRTRNIIILFLLGLFVNSDARSQEILQEVVVSPGDTMWSIANKYLKDPQKWPEIVRYNQLPTSDPTIALPGTRIKIPLLLIKEEYRSAQLVKLIPEVRYRRKGEQEWYEARPDMTLKYEDSLRTMKGAQARVRFPSKEVVQINENSYVVLKPEKILQEIQLLQGDVRASRAKVIMPGGTVVKPHGSSDYQAKVRDDETEVVFVYKGQVNVTARGKTVTVREGFGTQVPKSAPPMKPLPLTSFKDFDPKEMTTEAPTLSKIPQNKSVVKFNPPSVDKQEEPKEGSRSKSLISKEIMVNYSLQLATDDKFTNIVLEKTEPTGKTFDIKQEKIPDGNYFMRVAFIDALGMKGSYSSPNSIIKDTVPPELLNITPQDGQKFFGEESFCDVIGTSKGAALVAVNGEVVFVSPTGRFSKSIHFEEGPNKISVTARDIHGNESAVERTVIYKPNR